MKSNQVINGSFGEVWINDNEIASVKALEAIIELEFEDVDRPRKLSKGKKLLGWEGTGSITMNHVSSFHIKQMSEDLKEGRQTVAEIISKVDDPDALGAERIALKGVTFEQMTLAKWEAKTIGEREIPFSFDDYKLLDLI